MSEVELDDVPTIVPEINTKGHDTKSDNVPKRDRFPLTYGASFKDWFKQTIKLSDEVVESKFLSVLPFYPESDGKRKASFINTIIDDKKNYIHEFLIENTESDRDANGKSLGLKDDVKDIVIVHGYGASLGLFLYNFNDLSKIPGIRIHAIDLLGFGFSSRPKFPKFKSETVDDIHKIEDWFTDSIEQWRVKRKLNNFILIGHSFGGYLSSCYAMKYHKPTNPILNKLVLLSPVGVERNKHSLLKNLPNPYFDDKMISYQNKNDQGVEIEREINQPQINPKYASIDFSSNNDANTRRTKIINYLWENNYSPFSLLRMSGPFTSKLISGWTSWRFSNIYESDKQQYFNCQDYIYRIFSAKGSGEFAITRILGVGALAKLPLIDRMPQFVLAAKLPTLWAYGDKDWMNVEAGREMVVEINQLSENLNFKKSSNFKILKNAGHHLYMDNPKQFKDEIFKFLEYKDNN